MDVEVDVGRSVDLHRFLPPRRPSLPVGSQRGPLRMPSPPGILRRPPDLEAVVTDRTQRFLPGGDDGPHEGDRAPVEGALLCCQAWGAVKLRIAGEWQGRHMAGSNLDPLERSPLIDDEEKIVNTRVPFDKLPGAGGQERVAVPVDEERLESPPDPPQDGGSEISPLDDQKHVRANLFSGGQKPRARDLTVQECGEVAGKRDQPRS